MRVERRQVVEEDLLARAFRRLEVDRLDLEQREVALALLRRADLAATRCRRCAGRSGGSATARRRCRPGPAGSCSRARAGSRSRPAASRARPRRRSGRSSRRAPSGLEDQLLLAHAGRARHVQILGDLGELLHAHLLELASSIRSIFSGATVAPAGRAAPLPLQLAARLLRAPVAGGSPELFASLSISFHSSSSPSPVTAETGSTECSNTDSSSLSARIRSPRASLSIFVATTRCVDDGVRQPVPRRQVARQARMPRIDEQEARGHPVPSCPKSAARQVSNSRADASSAARIAVPG